MTFTARSCPRIVARERDDATNDYGDARTVDHPRHETPTTGPVSGFRRTSEKKIFLIKNRVRSLPPPRDGVGFPASSVHDVPERVRRPIRRRFSNIIRYRR